MADPPRSSRGRLWVAVAAIAVAVIAGIWGLTEASREMDADVAETERRAEILR